MKKMTWLEAREKFRQFNTWDDAHYKKALEIFLIKAKTCFQSSRFHLTYSGSSLLYGVSFSQLDGPLFQGKWLPWCDLTEGFVLQHDKLLSTWTKRRSIGTAYDLQKIQQERFERAGFHQELENDKSVLKECVGILPTRVIDDSFISKTLSEWLRGNMNLLKEEYPGLLDGAEGEYGESDFPKILLSGGAKAAQQKAEVAVIKEILPEIMRTVEATFGKRDAWNDFTQLLWQIELMKSINPLTVVPLATEVWLPNNFQGTTREALGIHGVAFAWLGKTSVTRAEGEQKKSPGLLFNCVKDDLEEAGSLDKTIAANLKFQPTLRKGGVLQHTEYDKDVKCCLLYFCFDRSGNLVSCLPFAPSLEDRRKNYTTYEFDLDVFKTLAPPTLIRMHEDGLPEYRLFPSLEAN
jgi:hypothetical protein